MAEETKIVICSECGTENNINHHRFKGTCLGCGVPLSGVRKKSLLERMFCN